MNAAHQLVNENLDLVDRQMAWMRPRMGANARRNLDDIRQEGFIGLWKAAERFDPARGVKFRTYARHCVAGHIYDALRRFGGGRAGVIPTFAPMPTDIAVKHRWPSDALDWFCRGLDRTDRLICRMIAGGMNMADAGRAIGCTQGRVNQRVAAMRDRFANRKAALTG